MTSANSRMERDSFGDIAVPSTAYWGAQTQRSVENFPIGGQRMPIEIVHALARIKRAAAEVNASKGLVDKKIAQAIVAAAQEVDRRQARRPLPARRLADGLGHAVEHERQRGDRQPRQSRCSARRSGSKTPVHPNDHVNMSQSSNDCYPDRHAHRRGARELSRRLIPALQRLRDALDAKAKAYARHHQDRPHPYAGRDAADARPGILRLRRAGSTRHRSGSRRRLPDLMQLAQGGTAVGTGLNAAPGFAEKVAANIAKHDRTCPSSPRPTSSRRWPPMTRWSSRMARSTRWPPGLFKIANDIRLLGSGPRSGLGELRLPENEPGSSIMPGKVNPTQCEAMTMVCAQVFGNTDDHDLRRRPGHFELNVYEPGDGLQLPAIGRGCWPTRRVSFTEHCVVGHRAATRPTSRPPWSAR